MSKHHTTLWSRRRFLALFGSTPLLAAGYAAASRADEKPRLDPRSDRAQKLHYTHDAATAEHPDRKANARCANCTHFHGTNNDAWNSCNIFPDNQVNADGWCSSWFGAA